MTSSMERVLGATRTPCWYIVNRRGMIQSMHGILRTVIVCFQIYESTSAYAGCSTVYSHSSIVQKNWQRQENLLVFLQVEGSHGKHPLVSEQWNIEYRGSSGLSEILNGNWRALISACRTNGLLHINSQHLVGHGSLCSLPLTECLVRCPRYVLAHTYLGFAPFICH